MSSYLSSHTASMPPDRKASSIFDAISVHPPRTSASTPRSLLLRLPYTHKSIPAIHARTRGSARFPPVVETLRSLRRISYFGTVRTDTTTTGRTDLAHRRVCPPLGLPLCGSPPPVCMNANDVLLQFQDLGLEPAPFPVPPNSNPNRKIVSPPHRCDALPQLRHPTPILSGPLPLSLALRPKVALFLKPPLPCTNPQFLRKLRHNFGQAGLPL